MLFRLSETEKILVKEIVLSVFDKLRFLKGMRYNVLCLCTLFVCTFFRSIVMGELRQQLISGLTSTLLEVINLYLFK